MVWILLVLRDFLSCFALVHVLVYHPPPLVRLFPCLLTPRIHLCVRQAGTEQRQGRIGGSLASQTKQPFQLIMSLCKLSSLSHFSIDFGGFYSFKICVIIHGLISRIQGRACHFCGTISYV